MELRGERRAEDRMFSWIGIKSGLLRLLEDGFEVLLDALGVFFRDLAGFRQRFAFAHRALVPDLGQPGIPFCPHSLAQEHHHAAVGIRVRILEGRFDGEEVDDLLSHQFMPLGSRVDTVTRVLELRILLPLLGECRLHDGVQIDYLPSVLAFRDQPFGVGRHDVVVIELGVGFVVDRRGHEDDLPSLCLDLIFQALHTLLVLGEAFIVERHVDPAVDPVAGDDEIGSQSFEGTIQTLVHIGSGEPVSQVTRFGKAGHGFARNALVQYLRAELRMVDRQPSLEKNNVLAPVGDAVPEEDNLLPILNNINNFLNIFIISRLSGWQQFHHLNFYKKY